MTSMEAMTAIRQKRIKARLRSAGVRMAQVFRMVSLIRGRAYLFLYGLGTRILVFNLKEIGVSCFLSSIKSVGYSFSSFQFLASLFPSQFINGDGND